MIECKFEKGNIADPGLRHIASGILMTKDGKVLLTKRAEGLTQGGKWCLPGGYMNRGDTLQSGVRREVLEETGWEVGELTLLYINDNPNRRNETHQNVDFIYMGEATEKVGGHDEEVDSVEWFDPEDLPEMAFDHDDYIKLYLDYLHKRFQLPVLYNR